VRAEVIDAYARSISTIWIAMTPIVGVCFILCEFRWLGRCPADPISLLALGIRKYTLQRTTVRGKANDGDGGTEKENTDIEKADRHDDNDEKTKDNGDDAGVTETARDDKELQEETVVRPMTGTTVDEGATTRPATGTTVGGNM
jgi:hypothetical protein